MERPSPGKMERKDIEERPSLVEDDKKIDVVLRAML